MRVINREEQVMTEKDKPRLSIACGMSLVFLDAACSSRQC